MKLLELLKFWFKKPQPGELNKNGKRWPTSRHVLELVIGGALLAVLTLANVLDYIRSAVELADAWGYIFSFVLICAAVWLNAFTMVTAMVRQFGKAYNIRRKILPSYTRGRDVAAHPDCPRWLIKLIATVGNFRIFYWTVVPAVFFVLGRSAMESVPTVMWVYAGTVILYAGVWAAYSTVAKLDRDEK